MSGTWSTFHRVTVATSFSRSWCPSTKSRKPAIEIRNQTLIYSIVFLVFAMPLYVTLVIAWIDRRLQGQFFWPESRED